MIPFVITVVGIRSDYKRDGAIRFYSPRKACICKCSRIAEPTPLVKSEYEITLKERNINAVIVFDNDFEYYVEETVDQIANAIDARVVK